MADAPATHVTAPVPQPGEDPLAFDRRHYAFWKGVAAERAAGREVIVDHSAAESA